MPPTARRGRCRVLGLQDRRPDGIEHQQEPEHQPHEQEVLPEPAQLHVLVALVTEPLTHKQALKALGHGCHLPGHRTTDDDQQAEEEEIAEGLLQRRGCPPATDRRRQKQSGGQEACGDGIHGRLRVPRPCHRVGDVLRQPVRNAKVAIDGQVHEVDADTDLEPAEEEDHVDPLHHGCHRWRHNEVHQRILPRGVQLSLLLMVGGLDPRQPADASHQQSDRDQGPNDDVRRHRVPHQPLLRPIVRVGDALPGPLGDARPSRPEHEACHLLGLRHVVQRHILHLMKLSQRIDVLDLGRVMFTCEKGDVVPG
mmetsp:Transcript_29861/g.75232  ORF Transcript_29861/g.75232 Transcript_29861/m.75232 type:complete len:310 (+) Transcript_29861:636-1565(+)